jgi:hypothetical protein
LYLDWVKNADKMSFTPSSKVKASITKFDVSQTIKSLKLCHSKPDRQVYW